MVNNEQQAHALDQRLQTLIDLVGHARHALRQDRLSDISSLEGDISALCADITRADKRIAKQMETRVAEMITGLELLADDLNEFRIRMKARIKEGCE